MIEKQLEKGKTGGDRSAEDYLTEGDNYRQKRKWHKAVNAYTKAIELDKNDFRSHERRARAYFELADYHQVVTNLTKAVEIKPDRYLLYDLRGRAHSMLGNKNGVTTDFARAVELHPGHNVFLHKALSFIELKDFNQALVDLNRAIELKTDYAYAYLNRGLIYQKLGKNEEARSDFQRTVDLDTNLIWSKQARELLQELEKNEI